MYRKGTNNPFIPTLGLNSGSFATIGNDTTGIGQRYPGMLGQTVVLDRTGALKSSYTTTGTLYEGVYQLVKATSALAKGDIVFWDTLANNGVGDFEVTHTVTAPAVFKAGIALCTVTSGEYCWIQIAGLASVKFRASVTDKTLGNLVVQTSLTAADADALADAGAVATAGVIKQLVGIAYELPADGGTTRVLLSDAGFYRNCYTG